MDEKRASRLLDLTGLTPDGLRGAIASEETHRAILDFLCAHEPDLIEAAGFLGIEPAQLAHAKEVLAR